MEVYHVDQKVIDEAYRNSNKETKEVLPAMALKIGKTEKEKADDKKKLDKLKAKKGKPVENFASEEDMLKKKDQLLQEKYPHYVKGSVKRDQHSTKLNAVIKCVECGALREVHTSDIFQVKVCADCRRASRAKKSRAVPSSEEPKKQGKVPKNSVQKMREAIQRDDERIKNSRRKVKRGKV